MDKFEDSFRKAGKDFNFFREEIFFLREEVDSLKEVIIEMGEALSRLDKEILRIPKNPSQTQKRDSPTDFPQNQTIRHSFKPLNSQNQGISTGNGGVQTDRQTDRQTDINGSFRGNNGFENPQDSFENVTEILDSLDSLKKDIRLKFKRLTDQELLVFSAIYQLEEEKGFSDYKTLSHKLSLTESSIRDYVRRLILKGIPVEKSKLNNKEIHLFVSPHLRKVVSLDTLMKLVKL